MQLLYSTDLALRTLIRLSAEPDRHLSTEILARELQVSRHHLQKVVQSLTDAGFLRTLRGVKGGVMLARPADAIRVGEVVRHQEREQAIAECFREGGNCTLVIPSLLPAERRAEGRARGLLQASRQVHAGRLHNFGKRRSGARGAIK